MRQKNPFMHKKSDPRVGGRHTITSTCGLVSPAKSYLKVSSKLFRALFKELMLLARA